MSERGALLFVAASVAALLIALHAALRPDLTRPNVEVFPDMARSPAGRSFEPSPELPGGQVLQQIADGVVLHGSTPFLYGPGDEEAKRAGAELQNPFRADDVDARRRGADRFAIYCALCHGADGMGRGPVVERGMAPPPPYQGASAMEMKDGQMFHLLTYGRGNMSSYAAQLPPDDRWRVILHVRSLQVQP